MGCLTSEEVMPVTALLPRLKVRLAQLSNSLSICSWMLVGSAVPRTLSSSSSEMKKNLHQVALCQQQLNNKSWSREDTIPVQVIDVYMLHQAACTMAPQDVSCCRWKVCPYVMRSVCC